MKKTFFLFFILFMILYLFFDDGGISTKSGMDFLFIPIISMGFAGVFTLFFSGLVHLFSLRPGKRS